MIALNSMIARLMMSLHICSKTATVIKVNGRIAKEMEMGFKFGKMAPFMKAIGRIT
jgi:hypothetical protein